MGTGWRRAFCTTIPRDRETERSQNRHYTHSSHSSNQQQQHQDDEVNDIDHKSVRTCGKLGLFSSISNPSTPRLQQQLQQQQQSATTTSNPSTPSLRCRTFPDGRKRDKELPPSSSPSPRSPFAILKNTLRLSKSGCGVCMQSVKTGQGTAIYTAECSHAFHFPCIAAHVRKQGSLICPVCNVTWKDVPLLSFHKDQHTTTGDETDIEEKRPIVASSAPATPTGTNRIHFEDKRIQSIKIKRSSNRSNNNYSDDEPLNSPKPGMVRFNPIPEEEDSGEFQGFFPPPKKPDTTPTTAAAVVEVKLLPEAAVVSASRSYETYAVALRVKAPPATAAILSPSHRAPVDLVTVLDVSGSMTGPKLQMLKRAMRLVISSLGSADRLSIVAFAGMSHRVLPLKRMTPEGQKVARKIIDRLAIGEGTSVSEALRKAAKILEDRREKNPVASIMLLSDGQDEPGSVSGSKQTTTNPNQTRFAHIEIPVQGYGYGSGAEDAFSKCVGGLLSVVVKDVRVQLGFGSGSAPAEIMAVYSCSSTRPSLMSCDSVKLGDLYAEEERELLVELRVPTSAMGAHHVMSVRCSYKDPVTHCVMVGKERALLVPRPHAVRSSDPRIERLKNLFIFTRAVAESRRLVDHGDFTSAHHLLFSARALVMQSGVGEEYARGLEGELAQVHWRRNYQVQVQREKDHHHHHHNHHQVGSTLVDENGEPLTPSSAWRAAEKLAKVAMMKKSLNRSVSDLHGFENARF